MAQHIHGGIFQFIPQIGTDNSTAREDSDVLQHILSPVAVAGSLYSHYIEGAAQLVDDQSSQRFAFHILGNDEKLRAGLNDLLQQRQDLLNIGNLLVCDQDAGIIQSSFHLIHICSHVSRDIASVKLHAFYQIQLSLHGLGLFDGNNAVSADLLHGIRHQLSYFFISCRDSGNSGDMLLAVYLLAHPGDSFHSAFRSLLHAFSQNDGISACRQVLDPCVYHCLGQNGCGGGTVAGHVIGLGSHFLHQLRAHVLKSVCQLDLLRDGHTVIGDQGSAEGLIEYYISSFRSKCHSHGVAELIDTGL